MAILAFCTLEGHWVDPDDPTKVRAHIRVTLLSQGDNADRSYYMDVPGLDGGTLTGWAQTIRDAVKADLQANHNVVFQALDSVVLR